MAEQFESFYIGHVPHLDNTHADALESLATSLCLQAGECQSIMVFARSLFHPKWTFPKDPIDSNTANLLQKASGVAAGSNTLDWRTPFIDYIMYNIRADNPKLAASIRKKAVHFNYNPEPRTLYYVTRDGIMLRCLSPSEAQVVLKEAHDVMCGAHQPGPKLGNRIQRIGYYWPKMMSDAADYARRCYTCQIHGDFKHQPVAHLAPTKATWHFEAWGIDMMGPIHP